MRKIVVFAILVLLIISGTAGWSILQPASEGESNLDVQQLGSSAVEDLVQKSGDTLNSDLDMNGSSINNFFGSCTSNDMLQNILDDGSFDCVGGGGGSSTLSGVLSEGNDAGDNDINMSGNNISGVSWLNPTDDWKTGGNMEQEMVKDPEIAGSVSNSTDLGNARGVSVSGGYAYVAADSSDALTVVDVSDPSSPSIVGSVSDGTDLEGAHDIDVSGGYAYVVGWGSNALSAVNISDPSNPVVVGSVSDSVLGDARGVSVSGGYAYVAARNSDALTVVDVSDPSSPSIAGSVSSSTELDGSYNVDVSGGYAFIPSVGGDSLTVVDISDPSSPSIVGSVSDGTDLAGAVGVSVSGGYAYVAAEAVEANALTVVDVSDPSSPSIVGSVSSSTYLNGAWNVDVAGDYAYVAAVFSDALTVVDVSDPSSPSIVGSVSDGTDLSTAFDPVVSGGYVYVSATNVDALTAVDITSIDAPTASIGNIEAGDLHVTDDATVGQDLKVGSGLNVGPRGIKTDGGVAGESYTATGSKNFVQDVNSTHSVVYGSSESSEAVVEYSATGEASPDGSFHLLPGHFREVLSEEEDYQVFATPVKSLEQIVVGEKNLTGFTLESRNETLADIHVRGVREGFEDQEVWKTR